MKEFNRTPPLDFYPRSPCGERRKLPESNTSVSNFYPRSPCGERRYRFLGAVPSYNISIHALLAESDGNMKRREGETPKFLSTLSLRRATGVKPGDTYTIIISIHALLAESYCCN